jgi:hypothetical protein
MKPFGYHMEEQDAIEVMERVGCSYEINVKTNEDEGMDSMEIFSDVPTNLEGDPFLSISDFNRIFIIDPTGNGSRSSIIAT